METTGLTGIIQGLYRDCVQANAVQNKVTTAPLRASLHGIPQNEEPLGPKECIGMINDKGMMVVLFRII